MSLRILVVDDSALYRKIITEALRGIPNIEIVGSAYSGKNALDRIIELKPDVLTVDLEMPDINGIELVRKVKLKHPAIITIMVSAFTDRGSSQTIQALEAGAMDFVTKHTSGTPEQQLSAIQSKLQEILKIAAIRVKTTPSNTPAKRTASTLPSQPPRPVAKVSPIAGRPKMLLIGVSTGGPVALGQLLPALGANLGVPVFIVQHMPPLFTKHLADSLTKKCDLHVKEAESGEEAQKNTVYIAPGGKHMRIDKSSKGLPEIRITEEPPENSCRPAVDVLFRSVAHNYPGKAVAVILTGMGSDGTLGLKLLKRHGCTAIAQDKESCVVYGMPGEAAKAGLIDYELPLLEIAPLVLKLFQSVRGQ